MEQTPNLKLEKYELDDYANLSDGYNKSMDILDTFAGTVDAKFPIGSAEIEDGGINTVDIANGAITSNKIASSAITSDKIATEAVDTDSIAEGAITTTLINDLAVTTDKLANGSVTNEKIATGTIDTNSIADDAITSSLIEDGAITASKIALGAITSANLGLDTVKIQNIDTASKTNQAIEGSPLLMLSGGVYDLLQKVNNQLVFEGGEQQTLTFTTSDNISTSGSFGGVLVNKNKTLFKPYFRVRFANASASLGSITQTRVSGISDTLYGVKVLNVGVIPDETIIYKGACFRQTVDDRQTSLANKVAASAYDIYLATDGFLYISLASASTSVDIAANSSYTYTCSQTLLTINNLNLSPTPDGELL